LGGTHTLRLYHDRIGQGETVTYPGACHRILYCRFGGFSISGQQTELLCDGATHCQDPVTVTGSMDGAILWRFELFRNGEEPAGQPIGAVSSELKLQEEVTLEQPHGYLIRCDAVNFPLNCQIYDHTHAGPGIRCLHCGKLTLDIDGERQVFGPNDAWFEPGPISVTGVASKEKMTGFIRVMVLPRTYLGKSSITYLSESDWEKPKRQTYKTYVDTFIEV